MTQVIVPRAPFRWPALAVALGLCAMLALDASPRVTASRDAVTARKGPVEATIDPRFGVVQAWEAPAQASALGVRWERVMFPWSAIQPDGPSDWNTNAALSDNALTAEIAAGRTPVGILLYTPRWAARDPAYGDASAPAGLDQPWDSAANRWGAFVRRVVAQYRGRIDTWIIWNEPDRYIASRNVYYNWHATLHDYYLLMKTAYRAAHDANRDSTVVMSGLTYWWDKEQGRVPWLQRYLELAAQDPTAPAYNAYFDAANTHLYANPLNAYAQTMIFHHIMQTHGGDKPVWISESNVIPTGDPGVPAGGAFRATLDQQASFVIEDLALALAGGAARVAIYKMRDGAAEGNGELYGLVRNDGSTRPAYRAYAVAQRYLSGATSAVYTWHADESPPTSREIDALLASDAHRYQFVWPAAVNTVVLQRPGQRVTVVWNAGPITATASIPVRGSNAILVDKTGASTATLPMADGRYHLTLQPSSNNSDPRDRSLYLTGGSPLILVEQMGQPTRTPTATPATPTPTPFLPARPVGTPASSSGTLYVQATRHSVAGPFLAYFTAHGGESIVGRPLTEAWVNAGARFQIFERLELRCTGHCDGTSADGRVTVEPLGLILTQGRRFPPVYPLAHGDATYRYFSSTRHTLNGRFATFWEASGGGAVLGPPISEPLYQRVPGSRLWLYTQYLRNARLELWPRGREQAVVRVGLLGKTYMLSKGWLQDNT